MNLDLFDKLQQDWERFTTRLIYIRHYFLKISWEVIEFFLFLPLYDSQIKNSLRFSHIVILKQLLRQDGRSRIVFIINLLNIYCES